MKKNKITLVILPILLAGLLASCSNTPTPQNNPQTGSGFTGGRGMGRSGSGRFGSGSRRFGSGSQRFGSGFTRGRGMGRFGSGGSRSGSGSFNSGSVNIPTPAPTN